jgi:radical SAM superfamily enzyme YgiQ (UPF0313 family)
VESGCQETLDRVRKGTKLKKIEEAFALAKRAGIETWAFFILGLPDENDGRIRKTIDFSKRIDPDVAKFHILKPFPGTEVYDELSEEGLIIDNDFDNYGLHTPPVHRLKELTPDQILRWQKRAYREFYLRPGVMLRHLLRLKSFNRIKLNMSVAGSILKNLFN